MINLKADTILSKGCRTKRKAIEAAKIPLRSPASGRKYAAAYYNIRIKKLAPTTKKDAFKDYSKCKNLTS